MKNMSFSIDSRSEKARKLRYETEEIERELSQYQKPFLGIFGGDKEKIKELKDRKLILINALVGLENNNPIPPRTKFILGDFDQKKTEMYPHLNEKVFYSKGVLQVKYDEKRQIYIIFDELAGEIGSLKRSFTTTYGTHRNLKGTNLTYTMYGYPVKEFTYRDPYNSKYYWVYTIKIY